MQTIYSTSKWFFRSIHLFFFERGTGRFDRLFNIIGLFRSIHRFPRARDFSSSSGSFFKRGTLTAIRAASIRDTIGDDAAQLGNPMNDPRWPLWRASAARSTNAGNSMSGHRWPVWHAFAVGGVAVAVVASAAAAPVGEADGPPRRIHRWCSCWLNDAVTTTRATVPSLRRRDGSSEVPPPPRSTWNPVPYLPSIGTEAGSNGKGGERGNDVGRRGEENQPIETRWVCELQYTARPNRTTSRVVV